jgi:hypothetical protein
VHERLVLELVGVRHVDDATGRARPVSADRARDYPARVARTGRSVA